MLEQGGMKMAKKQTLEQKNLQEMQKAYSALTPEQLDLIFDGDGQWVNTRFVNVAKHEQEKEQFV